MNGYILIACDKCLKCVEYELNDFKKIRKSVRCKRILSVEDGFIQLDSEIVSRYDCCDYFEHK